MNYFSFSGFPFLSMEGLQDNKSLRNHVSTMAQEALRAIEATLGLDPDHALFFVLFV